MTTLCATGKTVGSITAKTYDAYLWACGSYKYEIEIVMGPCIYDIEVLESSYEDAFKKFEAICVNGAVSMPINN